MPEASASRTVVVSNPAGIHARAATLIAELVRGFASRVILIKNHERVESTDVLQVLSLGAAPGEELILEAFGEDAEEVLDSLSRLFSENFHEE